MTLFCTAKHYEQEKTLAQVPQKPMWPETLPHNLASANLSCGMDKLLNLRSAAPTCWTASLPPLPGSNPVSLFLPTSQSLVRDSEPVNMRVQPEVSRHGEQEKPEAEKLKGDRMAVEQEFA